MNVYQDQNRSFEERAADLVSRLTLEEKVKQVGHQGAEITRLGIPSYNYWSEASHGCIGPLKFRKMDFTSFPVCLAMSQTWDKSLIKRVGSAISDEARAYANTDGDELHFYCPTINLEKDPRNGRSDENFGEDPYLAGKMSAGYIQGMQGEDDTYLKTVATPKHYALNSSENNRHFGSSWADEATIREYYAKVFEYAIKEGKAQSIMTSYNRVNGIPTSANEFLLTTLLREEWGFDGFVVSDGGAVEDVYGNPIYSRKSGLAHCYVKNNKEASAMTLKAGTDMTLGAEHRKYLYDAVKEGLIDESDIDRALIRIFTSRFRLGLFDDKEKNPFTVIDRSIICDEEKQQLAIDAASDSMVLLKNDKNLLPLDKTKLKKILVVGPNAIYRQLGGYSAGGMKSLVDTTVNIPPLAGIRLELENSDVEVLYEKGWCSDKEFDRGGAVQALAGEVTPEIIYNMMKDSLPDHIGPQEVMKMFGPPRFPVEDPDFKGNDEILFAKALEAAKNVDAVIVIAGTDDSTASEENDRTTLELPYAQDEKIKRLLEVNENTIVVLVAMGSVTGDFLDKAPTILNAHYAGQSQGVGIANVLFGNTNPNGKLSATWYRSLEGLPHVNDYGLKRKDTLNQNARTYMYSEENIRFPFGYGLSYTNFVYSDIQINKMEFDANETAEISVSVTNTGNRAGKEVVQMYVTRRTEEGIYSDRPLRQLKGFEKISLNSGETKRVSFRLKLSETAFWDNFRRKMCVDTGSYKIAIGGDSENLPCSVNISVTGTWDAPLSTVTISAQRQILKIGEQVHMKAVAVCEDVSRLDLTENPVAWSSENEQIVSVEENGTVTAKEEGTTRIKVAVTYRGRTIERTVPVVVKKRNE